MPRGQSLGKKKKRGKHFRDDTFIFQKENDIAKPNPHLLHADFSVSSSGDTYCAVPTNEFALAAKTVGTHSKQGAFGEK